MTTLAGLLTSGARLELRGEDGSLLGAFKFEPAEVEQPPVFLPRVNEAHTVTAGDFGNVIGFDDFRASLRRVPLKIERVEGDRVYVSNLAHFNSVNPEMWRGADLIINRQAGDTITEHFAKVMDVAAKPMTTLGGVLSGGVAEFRPQSYYKPGATLYLRAQTLVGKALSPYSAEFAYVLPAAPKGNGLTATSKNAPSGLTLDSRKTAPVVTFTDMGDGVRIEWDPAQQIVITQSWYPEADGVEYLTVDGEVLATDLVYLSKRMANMRKDELIGPRTWYDNATLKTFKTAARFVDDLPAGISIEHVEDGAIIDVVAGATWKWGIATHAEAGQGWYHVLKPGNVYRMVVDAEPITPTTMKLTMENAGAAQTVELQPGRNEAAFVPEALQTRPRAHYSRAEVPGPARFKIRNIAVVNGEGEPFDPTPEEYAMYVGAAPSYVRFHGTCKTNPGTYDSSDLLSLVGSKAINGRGMPIMLHWLSKLRASLLRTVDDMAHVLSPAGAADMRTRLRPWVQIEPHFTEAEWKATFAYMQSWMPIFEGMRFEVGNENWNSLAAFYTIPTTGGKSAGWWNGKLHDKAYECLLAVAGNDGWTGYLGGWATQRTTGYNRDSVNASKHADFFGFANYNGGWDSGLTAALQADDPAARFYTLANSNIPGKNGQTRATAMAELVEWLAASSVGRPKPIRAMHYEAGPGFVLNGLNGASVTAEQKASQLALMNTPEAGTATLDAFLTIHAAGGVSTNHFIAREGEEWSAMTYWQFGGAISPPYQWVQFMNWRLNGNVTDVTPADAPILLDKSGIEIGKAVKTYRVDRLDGTAAYAVVNVSPTDDLPATVPAGEWLMTTQAGDGPNNTAETATSVAMLSEDHAGGTVTIPAGRAMVWEPQREAA